MSDEKQLNEDGYYYWSERDKKGEIQHYRMKLKEENAPLVQSDE